MFINSLKLINFKESDWQKNMEDYEEKDSIKTSKINSAMLINLRLNSLWKDVHTHARRGEYSLWNDDLDRIWCELAGDVKEEDKNETDFNELNKKLSEAGGLFKSSDRKGFQKYTKEDYSKMSKQKILLMEKEIFLRRLQNKQGKGTAYDVGDDDYMD